MVLATLNVKVLFFFSVSLKKKKKKKQANFFHAPTRDTQFAFYRLCIQGFHRCLKSSKVLKSTPKSLIKKMKIREHKFKLS